MAVSVGVQPVSDAIAELLPGVTVTGCAPLAGGASATLIGVDIRDAAGDARRLVWRRQSPRSALSIDAPTEAATVRAARAAGVRVPEVLLDLADHPVLGGGYLMERVEGTALPKTVLRDPAYGPARERLLDDIAESLAAVHKTAPVPGLPIHTASAQLDLLAQLHHGFGRAIPVFELALRWLRARVPETTETVVVHGDFRLGNLMVAPDGLTGVLDWELAHLGDPLEDIGYLCAPAWRFGGAGAAAGIGTRTALYQAYSRASGRPVDRGHARFWEVLATLKWGVVCQVQGARRHGGHQPGLEFALIGRRTVEVEVDLLLLMDGVL